MKNKIIVALVGILICPFLKAQSVTVFNDVPFYSMYHYLGAGETLPPEAYSQIPAGAIRMHAYEQDIISRKLTNAEIASIGNSVKMNVVLTAACDNYDRLAGVNLVLVPKGASSYTYDQTDIKRIEIGRFITPFMNKNNSPTQVPFTYQVDNISRLLHDSSLMSIYDFWIEFRVDGYSAAAQTQVAGCAGRTDVFRGNLEFVSSGMVPEFISSYFLPISYRKNLNNYNATDVAGQTTRIVNFTLDQSVNNAVLYLITSNHGSNTGGEEYNRRKHYVYLDDQLIYEYKPGGKTCEDFRQYNTQGNGIYGTSAKILRDWLGWNNWCPGDVVPNREVKLGNLSAGTHSIKIDVPDAVFKDAQGNFPISMYIQNQTSGQLICADPTELKVDNQLDTSMSISWKENGTATNWQTLWSKKAILSTAFESYHDISTTPVDSKNDLTLNWFYEVYVKSKCTNDLNSVWVGPVYSTIIKLGTDEVDVNKLSVYPNPVKDYINIDTISKLSKVTIYNLEGKKVLDGSSAKINLSNLPKGLYLMKIDFANGTSRTQKVIKQ